MDHSQEHISIAVNEAHFSFTWHFNLVEFHFDNFSRVFNLHIRCLSANNIKYSDYLRISWIDQSKHIRTNWDMSCIQKFNSQSLILRSWYEFSFIVINGEVLACINESKVLSSLYNQVDGVFNIEDEGWGPIHYIVDIALTSSAHYEMVVFHTHINYSFSEIEIFIHFM